MNPRPRSATAKLSQPGAARDVDPIVLQIVEGTLNSIEAEIEYAIERTARSPMIREAHDYRVGLFDRHCRKLTGRSYSAMPNAVVRDFPLETMRPGDVFLMNDTYLTEGSIGHLPDLCSTVPVFHDGEVVAFIQAFGHHDDIGGRVPGSMPGTATTVFEEGLAVPPIKLYSAGVRNDAVFTIIKRNSRVPEMLAADLDSEVQACVMGARRMEGLFARFGRGAVEACFQAILDKCRDIYRNELLPKIADGEYSWEDYVEHDGVSDPKLHKLALKMIKRGGRITLDFTGTDPQSSGPINWPADYAGGAFLIKWIAPILRNLADTPERAAEIHVNEGVCEVFDVVFPPKGTLITPQPMRARSYCCVASDCWRAWWRRQSKAGCRPTRRPFVTPASSATMPTASRFSRAKCSGAVRAAAITPTGATPSISCRTRVISRPNSPRRVFRCWSRSSRCARTPAALASDGADWDTRNTTARWWIAAPSSPPTGCGSAATASTAGQPDDRSASRSTSKARRATSAAWSTASRSSRDKWCAWSRPAAAAGAIRSSASRSWSRAT